MRSWLSRLPRDDSAYKVTTLAILMAGEILDNFFLFL